MPNTLATYVLPNYRAPGDSAWISGNIPATNYQNNVVELALPYSGTLRTIRLVQVDGDPIGLKFRIYMVAAAAPGQDPGDLAGPSVLYAITPELSLAPGDSLSLTGLGYDYSTALRQPHVLYGTPPVLWLFPDDGGESVSGDSEAAVSSTWALSVAVELPEAV